MIVVYRRDLFGPKNRVKFGVGRDYERFRTSQQTRIGEADHTEMTMSGRIFAGAILFIQSTHHPPKHIEEGWPKLPAKIADFCQDIGCGVKN